MDPAIKSARATVAIALGVIVLLFCQNELLPGHEWIGLGWPRIAIVATGATALGLIAA
jgi:hypothetical protein